jgi:hypothetical protein
VNIILYRGSTPFLLLYSEYETRIHDEYLIDIIGDNEIKFEVEKINKGFQEEISDEWNSLEGISLKERNLKMLEKLESFVEDELLISKT